MCVVLSGGLLIRPCTLSYAVCYVYPVLYLVQFIAGLLAGDMKQLEEHKTKTMSRRKNNTVASTFSQSLGKLIATMSS